jgi:hypothetical protein
MMHNVQHQAQKSIDKILPRSRLPSQASLQELAIYIGKGHART